MKKRSALCAALALVLLLTGCRGRTSTTASQVHIRDYAGVPAYEQPTADGGADGTSAAIDPNADIQIDVWVDGTPSMAGFVAGDLATAYRKALPRIEETATTPGSTQRSTTTALRSPCCPRTLRTSRGWTST